MGRKKADKTNRRKETVFVMSLWWEKKMSIIPQWFSVCQQGGGWAWVGSWAWVWPEESIDGQQGYGYLCNGIIMAFPTTGTELYIPSSLFFQWFIGLFNKFWGPNDYLV